MTKLSKTEKIENTEKPQKTQKAETKKQTWWVVLMVSLMIGLSVYYWFTEDAPKPVATTMPSEQVVDVIESAPIPNTPPQNTDVPKAPEQKAPEQKATEQKTPEQKATEQKAPEQKTSSTDASILRQTATSPKGVEAVAAMQMARSSQVSQRLEQLTAKMTDAEATDEQIAEASAQHDALMDRESKVIALEEHLMQQYAHVVVTVDDAQQYTVNVHAPTLSKTEAANMMTAAIEQLHVAPQNVAVKLVR